MARVLISLSLIEELDTCVWIESPVAAINALSMLKLSSALMAALPTNEQVSRFNCPGREMMRRLSMVRASKMA